MPIYTYQCQSEECGHVEEDVLIMSVSNEEAEKPDCPLCSGNMEKKVSGKYLIHYKGSGFYQTDSNGKNYQ